MRKTNSEGYSDPTAYEGLKRASSASERHCRKGNGGDLRNGYFYDKNGQLCHDLVYRPDGSLSKSGDIQGVICDKNGFVLHGTKGELIINKDGAYSMKESRSWAYEEAVKNPDLARLNKTLKAIFLTCELAGFEVKGRIYLKDKKTGKVWR